MNYCLGFIFNEWLDKVLLIKKNKGPANMAGRLNGIGGKVEKDEAANDAMERECREETGLLISNWDYFCSLSGDDFNVYCYCVVSNEIFNYKQMEDEELGIYDIYPIKNPWAGGEGLVLEKYLGNYARMPNNDWLIPMALNHVLRIDSAESFNIKEDSKPLAP